MKRSIVVLIICLPFLFLLGQCGTLEPSKNVATERTTSKTGDNSFKGDISEDTFINLLSGTIPISIFDEIDSSWQPGYAPVLAEVLYFTRDSYIKEEIIKLLQKKIQLKNVYDLNEIYRNIWNRDLKLPNWYTSFKSKLYGNIDPRFTRYFEGVEKYNIRLDEIRWGGVAQNGIPPLRQPEMIPASEADYLEDSNIVFGIEINGDFRAYPKRILAWHEMFIDLVGGKSVTGAYCTLCGSMILYDNQTGSKHHRLGTSGFLYRSNKLMFDEDTYSLWNTLQGVPVVGPLVGQDIELERLPVVTTSWSRWKNLHPQTTVLSLNTGHKRDYSEGNAYKSYFATDKLMFNVPQNDTRLKNKAEILALHSPDPKFPPVAIASKYLVDNPLFKVSVAKQDYLVLTDNSGAHRVYQLKGEDFKTWDKKTLLKDKEGNPWKVGEDKLSGPEGKTLSRVAAHNAFWFGWHAAFSNTELIK